MHEQVDLYEHPPLRTVPASLGATVWRNLRAGRFAGPVHAVNPKHEMLDGQLVYALPAHLPEAPDLAVVCIPASTVVPLIEALDHLGTRAVISRVRQLNG